MSRKNGPPPLSSYKDTGAFDIPIDIPLWSIRVVTKGDVHFPQVYIHFPGNPESKAEWQNLWQDRTGNVAIDYHKQWLELTAKFPTIKAAKEFANKHLQSLKEEREKQSDPLQ